MYKVTVFKSVAVAEWEYDVELNAKFSGEYMTLYHTLTIPFPPFVGLSFSKGGWLPDPLTSVRYDLEKEEFVCHVSDDNTIPDLIDELKDSSEVTDSDIAAYINDELEQKKLMYLSPDEWGLYPPE